MGARATAIIPARIGSTRFPRKALADDTGTPMVVHVCQRAALAESVERVVVATDDDEIASAVRAGGFEAVMTCAEHENGTSRLAEAAGILKLPDTAIIVNVQGDEPEIDPGVIDSAVMALGWRDEPAPGEDRLPARRVAPDGHVRMEMWASTVASPFAPGEDADNPNIVKALVGMIEADTGIGMAIYFSRARVPHPAASPALAHPLKHIGIYAYQRRRLDHYVKLQPSPLERTERLEQLRWLEHGLPIGVAVRTTSHHGIDTPEQYAAFVERYRAAGA